MLSVLIPTRNDQIECNATIKSIRDTAGSDVEIVVVDDGSNPPLTLDHKVDAFRRIEGRAGVGPARHIAATLATQPYILIIDAHMRFEGGWLPKVLAKMKDTPLTVWGCTCVALSAANMEIAKANRYYHGATINFFGRNTGKGNEMQFIEPKWMSKMPEDGDEIQCVLGAAYFMHREFFFRIGGFRMLRSWGTAEPFLSLKAWLAGGECRFMRDVRIGHQFRDATTYTSQRSALLYNKLMVAATIFPEPAAKFISDQMVRHIKPLGDMSTAMKLAVSDQPQIEVERVFYESVFTRELPWFLEKFKVPQFWT